MSTPSSPEKKKGRQASYVPNAGLGQLETRETNEEKTFKQSQLVSFFGHNDPMNGVTKDNKTSPEKRKSSAIRYIKTPINNYPTKKTPPAQKKTTKDKKATETAKKPEAEEERSEEVSVASTQEGHDNDDDNSDSTSDEHSQAEVTKVVPGKKKPPTTTRKEEEEPAEVIAHVHFAQRKKNAKDNDDNHDAEATNNEKTEGTNNYEKETEKDSKKEHNNDDKDTDEGSINTGKTKKKEGEEDDDEDVDDNDDDDDDDDEDGKNEDDDDEDKDNREATDQQNSRTDDGVEETKDNEQANYTEAEIDTARKIIEACGAYITLNSDMHDVYDDTNTPAGSANADVEMPDAAEAEDDDDDDDDVSNGPPPLERTTLPEITEEDETGDTDRESDEDETPHSEPVEFPGGNNVMRKYRLFVKIKVRCQPSTIPEEDFVSELQFVVAQFKAADSSFLISPYPKETQSLPIAPLIHGVEKIPARVGELRQYFPNFYPRDQGGDYYVKALIGFNKPFKSVMEKIGWDLKMRSSQIFENDLQVPDTNKAGWFLWSLDTMALRDLEKVLIPIVGHDLALRFGAINMGERIQFPVKEVPRAVYVETASGQHVRTARILSKLYRKDQTTFPLNIKLRFASDMSLLNGIKTRQKACRMAYLQRGFCANVATITTWAINDLDTKDRIMEKSIRDLILGIKSLKHPTKNLFLSVSNGHKNKAVTILTVFPNMEEEAAIRTSTLLPFLSHFYPAERVSKYFTPDEVERCKDCYWDVTTQQVTSPIDAAINELAEIELIDPEYIFELPADLQGIGSEDISPVIAPAIDFESDSISTMRSGRSTSSRRTMLNRRRNEGRGTPGRGGRGRGGRAIRGTIQGAPRSTSAGTDPTPDATATAATQERSDDTTSSPSGNSTRSTTSGVTMDDLSIAESRIMIQVTQDNNLLLTRVQEAQTSLENRIDEQMQTFLNTLAGINNNNTNPASTAIPPTPTNNTTNPTTTPAPNTNTNNSPNPTAPAVTQAPTTNTTPTTPPHPSATNAQVTPTRANTSAGSPLQAPGQDH